MNGDVAKPGILNWLGYGLGRLVQFVFGWNVTGKLPDDPKYIIVAVHTSGWDLIFALMGMLVLTHGLAGMRLCWMGKQELFRPSFGWFMRLIGGIPIDRSGSHSVVDQSIAAFDRHERMAMIITPEGTRKRGRGWKTGFYYIAQGAHVPIVCGILDYDRKVVGPGLLLRPNGNLEADIATMKEFFAGQKALHPELVGEIEVSRTAGPAGPGSGGTAA
jgi:1-acyl-sn-glycerol-3-phosphate acyltransferase